MTAFKINLFCALVAPYLLAFCLGGIAVMFFLAVYAIGKKDE